MKKITSLTIGLIFIVSISFAQISEMEKTMSKGSNNSLTIVVPEADMEFTQKEWMAYMKGFKGKTKRNKRTGEIFSDNAMILDFGGNTTDVYATIAQMDSASQLTVWYDLGGVYLSSYDNAGEYPFAEKMLLEFALNTGRKFVENELKAVEKVLAKRQKELERLVATNTKLHADIESYKLKILEAEENIKKNENDQTNKTGEIDTQERVVESVKKRLEKLGN